MCCLSTVHKNKNKKTKTKKIKHQRYLFLSSSALLSPGREPNNSLKDLIIHMIIHLEFCTEKLKMPSAFS